MTTRTDQTGLTLAPDRAADAGSGGVVVGGGPRPGRGPLPRALIDAVGLLAHIHPQSPRAIPSREQAQTLARNEAAREARERAAYRSLGLGVPRR
jgi:hypothetical protein